MADKVADVGLSELITGKKKASAKSYSPEELDRLGAKPVPAAGKAFSPEEMDAMGAEPVNAAAPNKSAGVAIARGASSGATLGASGWISAAIDTAASKIPGIRDLAQKAHDPSLPPITDPNVSFDQRRQAYAGSIAETRQANPKTFLASEIAGSIAAPIPGAGAAANVVKGTTAAAKAGRAAISGSIFGAGSAIGHGLTEGKDAATIGTDALLGAGFGAASGAALSGLGHLAGKAVDKVKDKLGEKYIQTVGSEILGMTTKKATPKAWNQILSKEVESGVEANAAKNFVKSPAMAPVEAAARGGKWDEAVEHIDSNLRRLSPGRQANYATIDSAKQFEVGKGLDALEQAMFKAKNQLKKDPTAGKALEQAYKEWARDFSSVEANKLQRVLLRPQGMGITPELADELASIVNALPQTGKIIRSQLDKAVTEVNASADAVRFLNQNILSPKQGIMSWDPKATMSALELRAEASARQQSALQAFDKLNPNHSEQAKSAVKKAIVSSLEKHLDDVASLSPHLAKAVSRIRNDDVKFSVLLAAKQGVSEALEKSRNSEFKGTIGKIVRHAATPTAAGLGAIHYGQKTAHDLEEGNVYGAAHHGALTAALGGIAGHGILRRASIGANRLEHTALGQLQAQGSMGNPHAQQVLELMQRRPANAVIGAVTPSFLGQANVQPTP